MRLGLLEKIDDFLFTLSKPSCEPEGSTCASTTYGPCVEVSTNYCERTVTSWVCGGGNCLDFPTSEPCTCECPPGYHTVNVPFRIVGDGVQALDEKCVQNCNTPCGSGKCCLATGGLDLAGNPEYSCQQCSDSHCCQAGNSIRSGPDQVGEVLSSDSCVNCAEGTFEIVEGICQCTNCHCDLFVTQSEACKSYCCNDASAEERPPECNCAPPTLVCTGGKEPNSIMPPCECVCPSDKPIWACDENCKEECPSGQNYKEDESGNCVCACTNTCNLPKILNAETCACDCPNGKIWSCGKDCLDPCENGELRVLDENNECICVDECPEDKPVKCTPDGGAEQCYAKCPGGTTRRDGQCNCCEPGEITCMKDGKKICDAPCNDDNGFVQVGDSCDCVSCETGKDGNGNQVPGYPGDQVLCGGNCVAKCDINQILNSTTCQCVNKCINSCYKFENGQCIQQPAAGGQPNGQCQPWQTAQNNANGCECVDIPCPPDGQGNIPERDPDTGACLGQNGPPVGPGPGGGGGGGGGGGDGGGDGGGGGGGSSTTSCPPNASPASDGLCYCNSPSATNVAGSCACSPGYVFGSDGITCVPQFSAAPKISDAKDIDVEIKQANTEISGACSGVVCPDGQFCVDGVFGMECRPF